MENAYKVFPSITSRNGLTTSTLSLLYSKNMLTSFGWMTEAGFCYGEYSVGTATPAYHYNVFPYVKLKKDGKKDTFDLPITTCHTDNHVYILYSDCLTVISKITSNIIHTQYFNEPYLDMIYDPNMYVLWLHTSKNIYQMKLENEDDLLWQDYIEIGDFSKALNVCNMYGLQHSKKIARLFANDCFEKGDYNNAAINYASSNEKFEEVALKLLKKNQLENLKMYLELINSQRLKETDSTQKNLIATWGLEISLSQMNSADASKKDSLKKALKNWMREKEKYLDRDTVYQLLQHYGQVELFIEFARIKKDFETIIIHYINEKDYKQALTELKEYTNSCTDRNEEAQIESLKNIFVRYSHIFMKYEPKETIEILNDQFKSAVDPNKIISAIMNTERSNYEQVQKFLRSLIQDTKKPEQDKNIHNLYIYYLSQIKTPESKNELIEYLKKPLKKESSEHSYLNYNPKPVLFELDYAKKLFSDNPSALALVLALMGKYFEGVKTALDKQDLETAKFIAKNVDDIKTKKALWLEIFTNNKNNNFKTAIEIMEESNILKIEDVLPHIMDNIKIEEFKNQISSCINVYEKNIQELKEDITDYNKTAENIKNDIYKVKKRSMEVQYRHCKCEICQKNIKDDNIFLFPCGHMFDEDCIIQKLVEYKEMLTTLDEKHPIVQKMAEINTLRKNIEDIERKAVESKNVTTQGKDVAGMFRSIFNFGDMKDKGTEKIMVTEEDIKKLEDDKEKLTLKLSEECVLCGNYMVDSTQCKFVGNEEDWDIML